MEITDKYLDMNEDDLDILLMGVQINDDIKKKKRERLYKLR